jgi:hypothetical protein
MYITNALSFPIFFSKKSWPGKKWNKASEKLRIEMKIIGDKMKHQMKEVLSCFDILLPAIRTEVSCHFTATIKTIGFRAIFLMTHERLFFGR